MEKRNQISGLTSNGLATYAWVILAYTVLVILYGAFVRASGSGAGCGSHWPTCNGNIIPQSDSKQTLIEFGHRVTSGLLGPMIIGLVICAWRKHGFNHRVTKGAIWTFVFVLIEGGIGAGIVLFEYVADNPSSARAVWMGAHLINTLILLAITTATTWWASGGPSFSLRSNRTMAGLLAVGLFLLLIVGAFGAITALGDTLFPAESFLEGAAAKFDPESHFSVKARLWHPTIAVATVVYLLVIFWTTEEFWAGRKRSFLTQLNIGLLGLQILGGIVNVLLAAPIWMQIVHLLMADLSWIALIILGIESLSTAEAKIPEANSATELSSFSTGD